MDNRLPTFQYHRRTERRPSFVELDENKDTFIKAKPLDEGTYGKVSLFQNTMDSELKVVIKEEKDKAQIFTFANTEFTQGLSMWQEGLYWRKRYGMAAYSGNPHSTKDPHFLLFNYIEAQPLLKYKFSSLETMLIVFTEIIKEVQYIHERLHLAHRDLAARSQFNFAQRGMNPAERPKGRAALLPFGNPMALCPWQATG